jgi:formate hydrogenlyase subunit 6/NADH:ubiquinone oxidoreductase subunit I
MAGHDVYRQLQQHLDHLPQRYPATASGVEIRILERLFTRHEARLALQLSAFPEPAATIHRRLRKRVALDELVASLDALASRGLIHRIEPKGGPKYLLAPFVVGFYERQLPWLTAEFERDLLQYFEEGLGLAVPSKKTTQMRTVPIDVNLTPEREVGTYDDIRTYVRESQGPFALMDCICRLGKSLVGHTCEHTGHMQTCLTFGQAAEGMVQSGAAHFVSRDQVMEVLNQADHDGLVLQPENTQKPLFVCCCCGDCCGVLTNAKRFPEPAEYFSASYFASANAETCEACGTCLTRCRMDAVSLDTGRAVIARTHCIGCGLCVGTCPSGSITLTKKDRPRVPPKNTPALYMQLYRDRYGTFGLAKAAGKHLLGMKV